MAKSLMLCVVLLGFLNLSSSTHVTFMNCGEGKATSKIDFVDIDPCEEQPCRLKKGTEEVIHVEFIPSKNITTAKTSVHGHVGPLWIPFPVENPFPCKDHGIACPMTAGKTYTFKTVLPIKSSYPELQLAVKWEMKDQDDIDVFCWVVSVQIVSG